MKLARAFAVAALLVAPTALAAASLAIAADPGTGTKVTATQGGGAGGYDAIENARGHSGDYLSLARGPDGSSLIENIRARADYLSRTPAETPVAVTPGNGIDWTDVGIGIGIGLAAVLLLAMGVQIVRHPPGRHPPTRPVATH